MSRAHRCGDADAGVIGVLAIGGLVVLVAGIGGCCYVAPKYGVYQQELEGQAEYAKAESTRKVKVLEAQAAMEAAKSLAQAEVERAKGVAQANQIIGDSLRGNEAYLRYLWIHGLEDGKNQVVYVPTEAGLPILEAGRRPLSAEAKP